jgi:hypothetical protein
MKTKHDMLNTTFDDEPVCVCVCVYIYIYNEF